MIRAAELGVVSELQHLTWLADDHGQSRKAQEGIRNNSTVRTRGVHHRKRVFEGPRAVLS